MPNVGATAKVRKLLSTKSTSVIVTWLLSVKIPTVSGVLSIPTSLVSSLTYPLNVIVTVSPSLTNSSTKAVTTVLSSVNENSISSPEL